MAAVRAAIYNDDAVDQFQYDDAVAALDRLAARLQEAERQVERSLNWREYDASLTARALAAEAREKALREALETITTQRSALGYVELDAQSIARAALAAEEAP